MRQAADMRCICSPIPKKSWCGRILEKGEWAFVDLSHALRTITRKDPQQPCVKCLERAKNPRSEAASPPLKQSSKRRATIKRSTR